MMVFATRLFLGLPFLLLLSHAQDAPPQVAEAIRRADAEVEAILKVPNDQRTFENTLLALDDLGVRMERDTNFVIFMQYVSTDPKEREAARKAEEVLSDWEVNLSKREDLYQAIKAYADTKPKLDTVQQRLLDFTMRDYRRAGMDLPKEKRDRLAELEKEETRLATEFEKGIYEDDTVVLFSREELAGIPKDTFDSLKTFGTAYQVPIDGPAYIQTMTYAKDPFTRQRLWFAGKRHGGRRNVELLEQILKNRAEQAQILGYKTFADYVLEPRMAKNAAKVEEFYKELRPIVRKKAKQDFDQFLAYKRADRKAPDAGFFQWDYAFYKTKMMREKYAVDAQKVAEYFPTQRVVDGLFDITQRLYGLQYTDVTKDAATLKLPLWHPDVKLYEVEDAKTGRLLGHFYIDPYPRESKYNHAAVWRLMSRKKFADGTTQTPVAALVTNFTKPTADKPSLLRHDEVETFFHEFGHVMHNLLSEVEVGRFSGASTARDFVEAPSQMFENWVWDADVLGNFARHYKTGEPLPTETLNQMIAARTLGSGMETEGQIFLGVVDQRYHTTANGVIDTSKVGVDSVTELQMYKGVPGTYFQAGFGHLMGYQAAYYGYHWSLVYAADMFGRFKKEGLLNPSIGEVYRQKVLAKGGSVEEDAILRDFLGREPKMDAYLEQLGLKR
ncbi:MAG TPA: M3 family metallopeptidase [Fimbriimonas sp.]